MFKKYQYENVFVITDIVDTGKTKRDGTPNTKKVKKVMARLFDPATKKSIFKDVTSVSIPYVYLPSQRGEYLSYIDKNIKLSRKAFDTMDAYNKFIKEIKIKTGETVEIEIDGEMVEFDETIFEDDAYGYQNLAHTFIHRFFPEPLKSDHPHRTWFLDIETRSDYAVNHFPHSYMAPEEITMIQVYDNYTDQYIVMGRKDFTGKFDMPNVKYFKIADESKLLEFFIKLLEKMQPSIISGWNSMTFDMPYITNRIARVLDGFNGNFKEELNHKDSYRELPNVRRLSPVGEVTGRKTVTSDGMDGVEVFWKGIILADYKELALKYGFLGLPSYSLKNVANHFGLSQKIDNSAYKNFDGSYTGEGYIFPLKDPAPGEDPIYDAQLAYKQNPTAENWANRSQVVFNRFVDYSLRDVEILVELDKKVKYLSSHQGIAYTCSVSMDDNWGTLKHWYSMIYREAMMQGIILPLKQQHGDPYTIYQGGWVRTVPGKYDNITSFDFASLYPSIIRAFNIGGDTLLKEYQIPQELKDIREKYFTHFIPSKLNAEEWPDADEAAVEKLTDAEKKELYALADQEKLNSTNPEIREAERDRLARQADILGEYHELGSYVKQHPEINDLQEEGDYYQMLFDNADEIHNALVKYNVCVTPNGYFYRKDFQAILAERMETIFMDRIKEKKAGQEMSGVVEELKTTGGSEEDIKKAKEQQEYHENQSQVKKILLNSVYGSTVLSMNPFSQGRITGASITIAGRMSNRVCAAACNNKVREILGIEVTDENRTHLEFIPQVDTDSFYLNISKIMAMPKIKDLDIEKKMEFAKKLSGNVLQAVIKETIDKLAYVMNLEVPEALVMENEVITEGFVSLASKRYFTKVRVNDGVFLSEPKMKVVGVSLVSYSTPEFLKKKLRPVLDIVIDGSEAELQKYIREARAEFGEQSPLAFMRTAKVNNIEYEPRDGKYKRKKPNGKWLTAPLGSTAAIEHNRIVTERGITGRFPIIERGDSISYVYIRQPNDDKIKGAIGWTDPRLVEELDLKSIADYDEHWEKDFLNKIDIIVKPLKWSSRRTTQAIIPW